MKNLFFIFILVSYITNLFAGEFSWSEFKKERYAIDEEKKETSDLYDYIKSKYGYVPEQKTLKEKQEEANEKTLSVGIYLRNRYKSTVDSEEEDGGIGFVLTGKMSFDVLGLPLYNSYTTARLYSDSVMIGYTYRLFDKKNFFMDLTGGWEFGTDDTDDSFDTFAAIAVGYNFDNWGVSVEKLAFSRKLETSQEDNDNRSLGLFIYKRF